MALWGRHWSTEGKASESCGKEVTVKQAWRWVDVLPGAGLVSPVANLKKAGSVKGGQTVRS